MGEITSRCHSEKADVGSDDFFVTTYIKLKQKAAGQQNKGCTAMMTN